MTGSPSTFAGCDRSVNIVALPPRPLIESAAANGSSHHLTLVQAARLAGMTAEEFISLLGEAGVSAVDYPPEELKDEVSAAR